MSSKIVTRTRSGEWRVAAIPDNQYESHGAKRKNTDFLATSCVFIRRSHYMEIHVKMINAGLTVAGARAP